MKFKIILLQTLLSTCFASENTSQNNFELYLYITVSLVFITFLYFIYKNKTIKNNSSNKSTVIVYLFLFSFLILSSFIFIDLLIFKNKAEVETLKKSYTRIIAKENYLNDSFSKSSDYLKAIYEIPQFKEYLKNNQNQKFKTDVENLFLSFAKSDKAIMQLRYLDKDGFEKIRIDRTKIADRPYIIDIDSLQNKAHRDYFFESKNKFNVWYSNLDLNFENAQLQIPYNPTYRAMLPIHKNNEFIGVLVINYFANNLLQEMVDDLIFDISILDKDSFIVVENEGKNNWERYKSKTINNKFSKDFPVIKSNRNALFDTYVSYKLEIPLKEPLYMIFELKKSNLKKLETQRIQEYTFVAIIVMFISFIFIFIIGKMFTNLISKLEDSKRKEQEANKSKSDFLANMSHEIRTPLNGIIGLTNIVLDTKVNNIQNDYLEKIKKSSNALMNIINDILDYSKIESNKLDVVKHDFDVHEVLNNTSDLFLNSIEEKGLTLVYNIDTNLPNMINTDPLRLSQILNNLLGNAIKFTNNGYIIVHVKELFRDEENIEIEFIVEDSGIGISKENLQKLFEAFNQVDSSISRKYGGTGLGLVITKNLVSLLGGKINVESELNKGSKFIFTIKCKYNKNLNSKNIAENKLKNKKFLVVDDDNLEREYLYKILESWNTHIKLAACGKEALEILNKESFDYVLIDWIMPEIDGLEVYETLIKENKKNMPTILMVTAHSKEKLINEALKKGLSINSILSKPYTPSSLYNTVFNTEESKIVNKNIFSKSKYMGNALLVDDDEINLIVGKKYLEKFGLSVDTTKNAPEAISLISKKTYDIIFMDLQMPIMDGFMATRKIRQMNKNMPIIALSAAVMNKDKKMASDAGMNDHLSKPIDLIHLENILNKFLVLKEADDLFPNIHGVKLKELFDELGLDQQTIYTMLVNFAKTYNPKDFELENEEEFKSLVHKLKGTSGNLKIDTIFRITTQIEEASNKEECAKNKEILLKELEKTNISINKFLLPFISNKPKNLRI